MPVTKVGIKAILAIFGVSEARTSNLYWVVSSSFNMDIFEVVFLLYSIRFSNRWFRGFLARHRISLRSITKKAQHVPEDYCRLVVNWLQFNCQNSQPITSSPSNWLETVLCWAVGWYDLSNICNLDETPLPFEYRNGHTYNTIGVKTIWVKETKSGWDRQQASLVLCVFADEINWIPSMVLFHGQGTVYEKESPKYHPKVRVQYYCVYEWWTLSQIFWIIVSTEIRQ